MFESMKTLSTKKCDLNKEDSLGSLTITKQKKLATHGLKLKPSTQ